MKVKILKYLMVTVSSILITILTCAIAYGSFFSDLPSDSLYSPYIENLQEKHFIIGDTAFGVPLDTFRPDDSITRSEFTKITVLIYLAELFGDSENWDNMS
ncbi:S-layer homology domain-containing protein, partial [Patescibacteria group bacterium]|nr:S-layer homology domain-containing protein [Patescibacteria group bacterium]MBU1682785.1 S-layer homology domain-containing protein [Patescibacteria group bacterium]